MNTDAWPTDGIIGLMELSNDDPEGNIELLQVPTPSGEPVTGTAVVFPTPFTEKVEGSSG
jgi:hypothetical protein